MRQRLRQHTWHHIDARTPVIIHMQDLCLHSNLGHSMYGSTITASKNPVCDTICKLRWMVHTHKQKAAIIRAAILHKLHIAANLLQFVSEQCNDSELQLQM